jgi:hypothetical protein
LKDGNILNIADDPDHEIVITDPAGLIFIQKLGPGGAGFASGAIYTYLGIRKETEFPDKVKLAVTKTTDAV